MRNVRMIVIIINSVFEIPISFLFNSLFSIHFWFLIYFIFFLFLFLVGTGNFYRRSGKNHCESWNNKIVSIIHGELNSVEQSKQFLSFWFRFSFKFHSHSCPNFSKLLPQSSPRNKKCVFPKTANLLRKEKLHDLLHSDGWIIVIISSFRNSSTKLFNLSWAYFKY